MNVNRESEAIELKTSFSEWKEIIIALVAFANRRGGKVVIGLNDEGESTLEKVGKGMIEDFINKIRNNTDPLLYPSIDVRTYGPGEIVEVEVKESDNKPVFAFGRAYIRVGKTNQKLSHQAMKEMIKKYVLPDFDRQFFDRHLSKVVGDLDDDLIKSLNQDFYHRKVDSSVTWLKKNGLMIKNHLTNAAYLCFVKQNKYMSNAIIKAARFKGKKAIKFLDMKDFYSNIILAVDGIIDFIKRHINMEVIISGKARRDEVWDYPLSALREAVINAVVHRDYSDHGQIQIRIFDDRIEIWSPGLLPKELDVNNLTTECRSIPRNKLIAEVFHKIEMIEGWGTGFLRMLEGCRKNKNPLPEFAVKAGAFVVTFFKRNKGEGVSEGASGGVSEGVSEGVNELFDVIKKNPGKRSGHLALLCQRSQKTVERWLKRLKNEARIEFRGSSKTGGYYEVV